MKRRKKVRKSISIWLKLLGTVTVLYVIPQYLLGDVLEQKFTSPSVVQAMVIYAAIFGLGYAFGAILIYQIFWIAQILTKRVDPIVCSIFVWILLVMAHSYLELVHPMITDRVLLITTILYYSLTYLGIIICFDWSRRRLEEIDKTKK